MRHIIVRRRPAATSKMMRLPRGELEQAAEEHDQSGSDRNGTCERRPLHADCRQCTSNSKSRHSENSPNGEITDAHKDSQSAWSRRANPADSFAVTPQHGS